MFLCVLANFVSGQSKRLSCRGGYHTVDHFSQKDRACHRLTSCRASTESTNFLSSGMSGPVVLIQPYQREWILRWEWPMLTVWQSFPMTYWASLVGPRPSATLLTFLVNWCYSGVNRTLINVTQERWSADPAQTASTLIKGLAQTLISVNHINGWNKIDEHRFIKILS